MKYHKYWAGVYYHTDRFYAGLSALILITTEHLKMMIFSCRRKVNFYLIAGHVF
jgi:hypothetical protein